MANNLNPHQFGEYVVKDTSRYQGVHGGFHGPAAGTRNYHEAAGWMTMRPDEWVLNAARLGYGSPN